MSQQGRVLGQPLLDRVVAHEVVERVRRLDELDQAPGLPLDQPLLELLEAPGVELLPRPARRAASSRSRFTRFRPLVSSASCCGVKSARLPSVPSRPSNQLDESLPRRGVGHRHRERRHVRAADQPLVDLGELVGEQAEGDVEPLDVGVLRPRQQADQPRALGPGHLAQLRRRDQVLGIFEDHAEADLLGADRPP